MKIVFLNSCLEPERDGVGDHARRLAEECIRQGHACCTIALNDRYISEAQSGRTDGGVNQLRLPATLTWSERIACAQKHLTGFDPDWVSLQFVPYAFQRKGLPFGLLAHLQRLIQERPLQIMFHELWIGEPLHSPVKDRMIRLVQRPLIMHLAKRLKPQVVHTSNSAYVEMLRRGRVHAQLLRLFGNISINRTANADWLYAALQQRGLDINAANRDQFWLIGFFGTIHSDWSPEPLLATLCRVAAHSNCQVVLISIGSLGPGEVLWQKISERYQPVLRCCRLGIQTEDNVSQCLSFLDMGVATSPYSLIEKSSSVTAMLEHGLPVIVNRNDVHFHSKPQIMRIDEPLLHLVNDQSEEMLMAGLQRTDARSRLPEAARLFTRALIDAGLDSKAQNTNGQ